MVEYCVYWLENGELLVGQFLLFSLCSKRFYDKTVMVEYCVYWLENGEPMHEVFSSLAAAEMYSCAIRGKENIEWVEVSEEETIDLDELEDMFPDDFCGV